MKSNNLTTTYLLSYYMDYTFQNKLLAQPCAKNFSIIKEDLLSRFGCLELTDDDIKQAWKDWFDENANNGTLVNDNLLLPKYGEIKVIDQLICLAIDAIDNL